MTLFDDGESEETVTGNPENALTTNRPKTKHIANEVVARRAFARKLKLDCLFIKRAIQFFS